LFTINNDTIDSLYQSINLEPMDSLKVSFPTNVLNDTTHFTFDFYIMEVNGTEDENPHNNHKSILVNLPSRITLPFFEDFESITHAGTILDPDGRLGWEVVSAPNAEESNKALRLATYEYSADAGEQDFFFTDVFDLVDYKSAQLSFSMAYAQYSRVSQDGLKVMVSTDCVVTYQAMLFGKFGEDLATAQRTTSSFVPSGRLEWKEIVIDLSAYLGSEDLRIAFVGINDYGNNLYLDNILIEGETVSILDLRIADIDIPPVTCDVPFIPKVYITNQGDRKSVV